MEIKTVQELLSLSLASPVDQCQDKYKTCLKKSYLYAELKG